MNERIKNNPTAIIIGGVVVIVLLTFSLMFGGGMMSGSGGGIMNGYGLTGWSWGSMLLGSLGMVAFWIAVVWVIVWLVRRTSTDLLSGETRTDLELLQHRFAAGEINQAQYDSARSDLGL